MDKCCIFTLSLMELGAVVCMPNGTPRCSECPLQNLCSACAAGTQPAYPVKKKKAQRRIEELDRLFKRIYEDNISGKINDSRFQKLSVDYENEQTELTEKMLLWEQEIAKQEEEADSIEQFIRRAKKYPELTELTPAILNDLVNKVYVCAPDKSSGHRVQDVRISLACIGFLPKSIISEMVNHAAESRTA